MKNYWITLALRNGLKYRGCVSAVSFRAARELVYADVPRRTIADMTVTRL